MLNRLVLGLTLFVAASGAQAQKVELRLLAAELPPYTYQVPSASVSEIPGPGRGILHDASEVLIALTQHRLEVALQFAEWFCGSVGQHRYSPPLRAFPG
jgi:hypothetical protein